MNALRALIAGFFDALFGWGQKQAEKPKEVIHAQTDEKTTKEWNKFLADNGALDAPDRVRKPKNGGS